MSLPLSTDDIAALERAITGDDSICGMLAGDPERARIRAEVARVMAAIAKRHDLLDPPGQRESSEIRTTVSGYRVSATYIDGDWITRPDMIVVVVDPVDAKKLGPRELAARFFLTRREIEAAQLLKRGLSSREIARALGISVNTARRHIERVLLKLDLHSRRAVAARLLGGLMACGLSF